MTIYLYPLWLRAWHWLNAFLFLLLIVSGISLHYSSLQSLLMSYRTAISIHNFAGIVVSMSYLVFIIGNFISGNWKHYFPTYRGIVTRLVKHLYYYSVGMFRGDLPPFDVTQDRKFNVLQKLTYLGLMYVLFPLILLTGWLMLFPESSSEEVLIFDTQWPMAMAHIIAGLSLGMFMCGHIYIATIGNRMTSNLKSMVTGWKHQSETTQEPVSDNKQA